MPPDVKRFILVGHDWGAGVAWATALQRPERIKKLAILNVPHPKVFQEALSGDRRQMLKSWYMGFFQIPWLPETLLTLGNAQIAPRRYCCAAVTPAHSAPPISANMSAPGNSPAR